MSSMLVSADHELVFVDIVKGMPVLLVVSELRFQLVTTSINWWKKSTVWKKISSLSSFLQVFVQLHSSKQGPMAAKRRCFLTSGCLVAELVPPIPLLQGVILRLVHPESSVCASAVFILCQDVPIIVSCPTGARRTS